MQRTIPVYGNLDLRANQLKNIRIDIIDDITSKVGVAGQIIYFSEVVPLTGYTKGIYEWSVDDSAWVKGSSDLEINTIKFKVGDLSAPTIGSDEYNNPALKDSKFIVLRNGYAGAFTAYTILTLGGFKLINPDVFGEDEEFVILYFKN